MTFPCTFQAVCPFIHSIHIFQHACCIAATVRCWKYSDGQDTQSPGSRGFYNLGREMDIQQIIWKCLYNHNWNCFKKKKIQWCSYYLLLHNKPPKNFVLKNDNRLQVLMSTHSCSVSICWGGSKAGHWKNLKENSPVWQLMMAVCWGYQMKHILMASPSGLGFPTVWWPGSQVCVLRDSGVEPGHQCNRGVQHNFKGRENRPHLLIRKTRFWKHHVGSEIWLWWFLENVISHSGYE